MTTIANATVETTALQMVRAQIGVREFQRWMGERRLQDPDHAMHCLLIECFGNLAPKPFRLIMPRDYSRGVLYGYSMADADALREAADICACPLQSKIIPATSLDSKPMPSGWQTGRQLGFETRIRPIIRCGRGADRPGTEKDAFQAQADAYSNGEMPRSREEVYREWLAKCLNRSGGAELESASLQSFQRTRAVRKLRARHSEGPDAIMRGILTITDPDAFAKLLARGIGRHRTYGYGMMLLRPART